jgi:quercetin dioxygenase-like cupin family protein
VSEALSESFALGELLSDSEHAGRPYLEFLRRPSMSLGLYVLPAGAVDGQQPHAEDEVYYVLGGSGRFIAGEEEREVSEGDVLFVAAGVGHRFHSITEELRLLVFFAPAEGSQTGV